MVSETEKISPAGLTAMERLFVDIHCSGLCANTCEAYIRAGFQHADPEQAAWELLQRADIQNAIFHRKFFDEVVVTPERISRSIGILSSPLNSMSSFMEVDKEGNFVRFNFRKAIEIGAMPFIRSVTLNDAGGIRKIDLHDMLGALTLAARTKGMLSDKIEHTGPDGGPIQHQNKFIIDASSDPESFDLIDRLSQRMEIKPGGAGEPSN